MHRNRGYDELIAICRGYLTNPQNYELIQKAYDYICDKHANQFRKSGEPYRVHLIEVACTLAELHSGPVTIAAGLLHDIIEDCDIDEEQLAKLFTSEIAHLVMAVTKITKLSSFDIIDYQAENHRKLFIAMARDIRVIVIKLADRLHNMRTLNFMPKEKQLSIAKETLEIYTPIAHRLGIYAIKTELEDLSIKYLEPEKYENIVSLIKSNQNLRNESMKRIQSRIEKILFDNQIPYEISGRVKSIYSIYKKMYLKDKNFNEIYDLQALRIITHTKTNCYEVLGYIHDAFRPIPGRFKDYIAMPKPNLYQSLHTTIISDDRNIFEIQIRTKEMDETAETGIAAHWRYKENIAYDPKVEQKEIEEKLHWFKDLISISDDDSSNNAKDYMEALTRDIFEANVYVMTPKGRVIDLPNGATPIDFAYKVHTQVGHTMIGAMVNSSIAPLTHILKTGDIVDIKTNKNTGPSEDWLKIAKTSYALNHIRKYLSKQLLLINKDEAIASGKELFSIAVKEDGMILQDCIKFLEDDKYKNIRIYENMQELYAAIGYRHVSAGNIVAKIHAETKLQERLAERTAEILNRSKKTINKATSAENNLGIIIEGLDNCAISMAQCCAPIPGDEIIGFISKGLGVKIHRTNCPNMQQEKRRLIAAQWDPHIDNSLQHIAYIQLTCSDRPNLLMEIINCLTQGKISMQSINGRVNEKNSIATFNIIIKVSNADQLRNVFYMLDNITGVLSVERISKN